VSEAAALFEEPSPLPRLLCLLFHVGEERYAIKALDVHKVVEPTWVNRLPRLPPAVAGITQHRGRVVTVVDLAAIFGAPPRPFALSTSTRVLVLDKGQRNIGLWVDAVDQIASVRVPAPRSGEATALFQHQGAAVAALSATQVYERLVGAPEEEGR
jgi:purine-binding chemotaxis protein CheW